MVTTGQQTGLFTGPLYTVHKILTAVRLAAALERELGVVVLPVFWAASEDHDWAEVDHADVLDRRGEVRRIRLEGDDPVPLPMSDRTVGKGIESALGELVRCAFRAAVCRLNASSCFDDAYRPEASIAGAFRETVESLFAPFDVLVTDAADPALKRASAHVLEGAILRTREHEALLRARTEELLADGYHGQVAVLPDGANVFYHGPAGRERLYARGDGWIAREARRSFTAEEIREEIAADPARFSPNVFLRPVVESAVFPTLAYVGGPGEMAVLRPARPALRRVRHPHAGGLPPLLGDARLPRDGAGDAAAGDRARRSWAGPSTRWCAAWRGSGSRRRRRRRCARCARGSRAATRGSWAGRRRSTPRCGGRWGACATARCWRRRTRKKRSCPRWRARGRASRGTCAAPARSCARTGSRRSGCSRCSPSSRSTARISCAEIAARMVVPLGSGDRADAPAPVAEPV